jgi:Fe-S cluster assembly iron-binding protein IscA
MDDVATTGITIVVDEQRRPHLAGAVIDWDGPGKGFRFNNPNVKP